MYCSKCGTQIPPNANFCPKCGQAALQPNAAQQPVTVKVPPAAPAAQGKQAPQKKKPGCFMRLLKGVGIFLAIILVIGILGSSSDNDATDPAGTTTARPTATATKRPTATPKPTQAPKSTEEKLADHMALIQAVLSETYDFCEVKLQDDMIVVNVSMDGLTEALVTTANYGGSAEYEAWAEVKNNFLTLGKEIGKGIKKSGLDYPYMLNLVNDQAHDRYLLIVTQDVIFYDCLAAE